MTLVFTVSTSGVRVFGVEMGLSVGKVILGSCCGLVATGLLLLRKEFFPNRIRSDGVVPPFGVVGVRFIKGKTQFGVYSSTLGRLG